MSRCTAEILILDDRMGGFVDRCDCEAGHPGPHRSGSGTATQPESWRSWIGSCERSTDD